MSSSTAVSAQAAGTVGAALFPKDMVIPPRAVAEQSYNIQRWTKMSAEGHFAALERPKELVKEIRAFFRPLRD